MSLLSRTRLLLFTSWCVRSISHFSYFKPSTKLSCFTASNTGPFINLKVQRKVSVQDICIAQVNLVQPCGAIVHCGAHHPDLPLSTIIQLSLPSLNHLCQFLSTITQRPSFNHHLCQFDPNQYQITIQPVIQIPNVSIDTIMFE